MEKNISSYIQELIDNNEVILFMKGTALDPRCGFSATVVKLLNQLNIKFLDIDILEDEELRHGIKVFSDWPTIPQLYIKGQFIGGCDIVLESYKNKALFQILKNNNTDYTA